MHKEEYKCYRCSMSYDAFRSINPLHCLELHLATKHKENFVFEKCKECECVFRDEFIHNGVSTFSAQAQLSLHRKYLCFNFRTPVNYNFFTFININQTSLSTSECRPLEDIQIIYPGETSNSIFRLFDQLLILQENYLKSNDDETKNSKLKFVYEQTLEKGGLYVTLLKNRISFQKMIER